MFCHFQGKIAIWPRVQMANDAFQRFLELYPYLYPVQLPNYLGAVPGARCKTLRYIHEWNERWILVNLRALNPCFLAQVNTK